MNVKKISGNSVEQNVLYKSKNPTPIKASSESLISYKNFVNDIVSISEEAKKHLTEDKNLINFDENLSELKDMLNKLDESSDSGDHYTDLIKCIQIAMRIMSGDSVPNKDKSFLAEHEPQMYSNAMLLKQKNDKPKKYDSILEDEKHDTTIDTLSLFSFEGHSESPSKESISINNIEISSEM